jgi:hypothetical protein
MPSITRRQFVGEAIGAGPRDRYRAGGEVVFVDWREGRRDDSRPSTKSSRP